MTPGLARLILAVIVGGLGFWASTYDMCCGDWLWLHGTTSLLQIVLTSCAIGFAFVAVCALLIWLVDEATK